MRARLCRHSTFFSNRYRCDEACTLLLVLWIVFFLDCSHPYQGSMAFKKTYNRERLLFVRREGRGASDARQLDERDTRSFLVCLLCLGFGFQPLALSKEVPRLEIVQKSPSFVWFFIFFPSTLSEGCLLPRAHLGVLDSLFAKVPLVYFSPFLFILSNPSPAF